VFGLLVNALPAWFAFHARAWQLEGRLLPTPVSGALLPLQWLEVCTKLELTVNKQ